MIDFRKLEIWSRSHAFVIEIYGITKLFPKEELFNMISQIRRATVSMPTNIAEGCGRNSDAELSRFLVYAMGSASEVEYLLILSKDLKYISTEKFDLLFNEISEIRKMLNSFIKKVNERRK